MKERTAEQTLVWQYMQRLAETGLGTCDESMELRDKFALHDDPRANALTIFPQSNGFIRSSKDDLLVRKASSLLERELADVLNGAFRKDLEKGLVFSWSKLRKSEIDLLFNAILRVAQTVVISGKGGQPQGSESGAHVNYDAETLRDAVSTVPAGGAIRKLGPYMLVSEIGRGGFGVVWLAEMRGLVTTKFALKLPSNKDVDLKCSQGGSRGMGSCQRSPKRAADHRGEHL